MAVLEEHALSRGLLFPIGDLPIGRKVGGGVAFSSVLRKGVKHKYALQLDNQPATSAFLGAKGLHIDRRKVLIQMPTGSQLAAPVDTEALNCAVTSRCSSARNAIYCAA
jgi:hypothetical protein